MPLLASSMSKNVTDSKSRLEQLSFLLGDWRGQGEMTFGKEPIQFEHRRRVRMTSDGSRMEIAAFSDNPKTEEMFNGEHSFIYVDSGSGELRLRRQWFLDSGFDETTERVRVARDGDSVKFEGIPELSNGQGHQVTIRKVGNSELVMEGEVIAGGRHLPYKTKLTKRVSKG